VQKFFIANTGNDSKELDFFSTAKILETTENTNQEKTDKNFYGLLDENKKAFVFATTEEMPEVKMRGGRDSATQILRILKATMKDRRQFTEDQELYLKKVIIQLEEGGLPKQTTRVTLQVLNKELETNKVPNPLRILGVLETNISNRLLSGHFAESGASNTGKREVILSEYLIK
jgi:hypothetical protein